MAFMIEEHTKPLTCILGRKAKEALSVLVGAPSLKRSLNNSLFLREKRTSLLGFTRQLRNKEPTCRRCEFHCWVGKIPWRKKWQLAPVLSPGKFQGQRSLAGYGPPGPRESDTTEPVDSRSIGLLSFLVSVVLITTSKYLLIFMRRIDFVSGDQCLTS